MYRQEKKFNKCILPLLIIIIILIRIVIQNHVFVWLAGCGCYIDSRHCGHWTPLSSMVVSNTLIRNWLIIDYSQAWIKGIPFLKIFFLYTLNTFKRYFKK